MLLHTKIAVEFLHASHPLWLHEAQACGAYGVSVTLCSLGYVCNEIMILLWLCMFLFYSGISAVSTKSGTNAHDYLKSTLNCLYKIINISPHFIVQSACVMSYNVVYFSDNR